MRQFIPYEITDHKTGKTRKCYLVKYEKRIFKTIRIGTLEYYRHIEDNHSDPMEGRVEGMQIGLQFIGIDGRSGSNKSPAGRAFRRQ